MVGNGRGKGGLGGDDDRDYEDEKGERKGGRTQTNRHHGGTGDGREKEKFGEGSTGKRW